MIEVIPSQERVKKCESCVARPASAPHMLSRRVEHAFGMMTGRG